MFEADEINLISLSDEIGIDEESVTKLLSIYVEEMTEEMQQVKNSLHNQDWAFLQKTIHNIKGVSANLYLQNMFKASEEVDLLLKNNNYKNIDHKIQNLLDVFCNTQNNIQKTLTQYNFDSHGQ